MDNLEEKSQFLFYNTESGKTSVQVIVDSNGDTIWTTQKGMSEIFGVQVPAISKHLKNIFEDGELEEVVVVSKMETTTTHGAIPGNMQIKEVKLYNLDAIISVGYRVSSTQATRFRIWATSVLKEYLIKGFALDDERLKQGNKLFGKDHFQELIGRIREIRASERLFYEKITDLYRDWAERLNIFLKFNEYPILDGKGMISSKLAKVFAMDEFSKFRVIQDKNYESDFNKFISISSKDKLPIEKFVENESNKSQTT